MIKLKEKKLITQKDQKLRNPILKQSNVEW